MEAQRARFLKEAYLKYLRSVNRPVDQGNILTPQIILNQALRHSQITLPPGSFIFIRADIDGKDNGIFPEKLKSQVEVIKAGVEQGWNTAIVGHRRRPDEANIGAFREKKPDSEIGPAFLHHNDFFSDVDFLKKETDIPIDYIRYWLTPEYTLTWEFISWVAAAKNQQGKVVILENDRLWPAFYSGINAAAKSAKKGDFTQIDQIATEIYYPLGIKLQELGFSGYIFDGSSAAKEAVWSKAGIAPFMEQIALGPATERELKAMAGLINTDVYYLSGSKVSEKFPALLSMIKEGKIPLLITGGVIGFAMRYCELVAKGDIKDTEESRKMLGALYNNPPKEELQISDDYINQGIEIYKTLAHQGRLDPFGLRGLINPIDFVSHIDKDVIVSFEEEYGCFLKPDEQQWDIGPKSIGVMNDILRLLPSTTTIVISGTPGRFELGDPYHKGFLALRGNLKNLLVRGGRVIGTGSEGNEVLPEGEHVIAGGVAGQFVAGTTPAAYRIFDEHPSQFS